MTIGVNVCHFLGVLGRDPEVRYTNDGTPMATISIAVNRVWKDKQGQKQQACEWVRCCLIGQQAEFCGEFGSKGSQVFVEGRMQTRKWQAKDGTDRYTTEIIAKNFQLLGGKPPGEKAVPQQYRPKTQPEQVREDYTNAGHYDADEVPF